MRIVVVGAYGLIGGYVTARLARAGHAVVGVGRSIEVPARRFPFATWKKAELRTATVQDWGLLLDGADAVVNCAGALQDGPRDDLDAVHREAVARMAEACARAGVRRFVQISAIGVDDPRDRFGQTKQAADAVLAGSSLDWTILRPGLVLAPAAYGGSALLRGLAAFPLFVPAIHAGAVVQVTAVEDLAEAVACAAASAAATRQVVDLVAPEATTLRDIILALRAWLGIAPAPVWSVPAWAARAVARTADGLALLGWRSPMRSTSLGQLAGGLTGDASSATALLGRAPRGLRDILAAPSGVQERWFARLYFIKPAAIATLSAFWIVSGMIGLARMDAAAGLLAGAMPEALARAVVVGGGIADIGLGLAVLARRTAPTALAGMMLVTAAYLAGGAIWTPQLWADPLGPLIKSIPAALLALATLAMMDER